MTQPTIMDCFDRITIPESNNETEKIVEDEIISENITSPIDDKEIIIDSNGIIKIIISNIIYKTWTVELIISLIIKFLKEKCPDSLMIYELNKIDITIINKRTDEIIPVEIQKTIVRKQSEERTNHFSHSMFEQSIRKQLEDNITNYGKCWLFIDSEYLRYLQSGICETNISIDMTWLVKLMRENTLKVFAIKYDGTVKELTTKDFDFLKIVSQTCVMSYDSDERVLNRNKLKMFKNVVLSYKFTQEEIDEFYKIFNNRANKKINSHAFFIKHGNDRCKLYGYILSSIGNLSNINQILDMNTYQDSNSITKFKQYTVRLGIFEDAGTYGHSNLIKFVDKFDICKYFPGYIRNKKQWDGYKDNNLTHSTFTMIANGSLKQNKTMMDY